MTVAEPAPAKINLALHVRRRRPDGYHDIETLFAFARDGDVVRLTPTDDWSLTVAGPFAIGLSAGPDNLVLRAAHAFADRWPIDPQAIELDKRLPVASGIGGGSADAAATLRALARISGIAATDPALIDIAASLGADVPACLIGRTMLGEGRGDALVALDDSLAETPLLLVNPGVAVSTAAVFAGWDGIDRGPLATGALLERALASRNDLEPPARAIAPAIGAVLEALTAASGVLFARMSGSGATCFALFSTDGDRDAAAARFGHYWTLATEIA